MTTLAMQGWVDLISLLVNDLHNQKDAQDQYQFTPLHSAANGGHVGAIRTLLDFHHAVDMRDHQGISLPAACMPASQRNPFAWPSAYWVHA